MKFWPPRWGTQAASCWLFQFFLSLPGSLLAQARSRRLARAT